MCVPEKLIKLKFFCSNKGFIHIIGTKKKMVCKVIHVM